MFEALRRAWRQYQETLAQDPHHHDEDAHDSRPAADGPGREPSPFAQDHADAPARRSAFAELGVRLVAHLPPSDAEELRALLQAQLEEDEDPAEALAQWFSDRVDPHGEPLGFIAADWKAREEIAWQAEQLIRAHGLALPFAYDIDADEDWKGWRERGEFPVDTPLRRLGEALAPHGLTLIRFAIDDVAFAFALRAEDAQTAVGLCRRLELETRALG